MANLALKSTFTELGQEDPDFVHLDDRYKCCYCKHVLRNSMQTRCGHSLCEKCVDEIFASGEPIDCPAAEEDCERLKRNDISPDYGVRREIQNLSIHCKNSSIGCVFCAPWKDIEQHEENDCPEGQILCPFDCGAPQMKRKELTEHLMSCTRKPLDCKFKTLGCTFTGSADELAQHEREHVSDHLELITVYAGSMDLQRNNIRERLEELTLEREDLMKQLSECRQENEYLKNSIKNLEKIVKDTRLKIMGHTKQLFTMEQRMEELPRKERFEEHSRDLATIKEKTDRLQQQILSMDGDATVSGYGTLNAMADALTTQLAAHDRQIGIHDVRIAEMDLRFQILEPANYEGVLVWKIKDYMRQKQEAINGRTLSLYSQPFYTSQYGYKMCAQVYLNGDRKGKSMHISLFFVLMRGEYDALMPWPFQRKVTLYLLDQARRGPHMNDLSEHFHPDPNSSIFKQPTLMMNIALNCPLVVTHLVVENPHNNYLKDDTIIIKVVVENVAPIMQ
ncbi:TNF receptor-associated factor 3-like [Gigantopelta aegis]|uniref:TNF receptor-associated factor 3-like n=1 Tax=Gigantopelta aegis TaxID=1735272 RepID=UPI001B8885C1|nr:TNF receptor-associated factor 3-like [Gigantopelta aegis]